MQNWITNSPYGAVNLYIGGSCRSCPNSALTASYVSQLSQQGWKFIPTWVGPQSAGWGGSCGSISNDPATAYNQGVSEANAAIDVAIDLGLALADGSGTIIYYDLENYDTTNIMYRDAAKSFISGWTGQLHARGSEAGVYGSSCGSGISDFASISNVPDAIWSAHWLTPYQYRPDATVWDVACLSNGLWVNHQRIRQYAGGHEETWGGVTLNIDSNVIDGIVASIIPSPNAEIIDQSISPTIATLGDELRFVFSINNPNPNNIENVRLGAQIRTHDPQGPWIDDPANDQVISLEPGANNYVRTFIVPQSTSSGFYDARWVILDDTTENWIDSSTMTRIFEIRTGGRTGGPDDFGYTFKDSNTPEGPTYNWIEISGTGTEVLPDSDDSWVEDIGLGFFFNYYGTDYSQLAISNNGLLFSGGTTWQYVNEPITQTPGVHGFIAPFWDDIVTWDSAGAIYYKTIGTAPNRLFVVEWYDNQHYSSSTSGVTFEAILYEGSNNILFQYKDVDFGNVYWAVEGDNPPYDNGGSATVGIEGPAGDDGLQYSFNEQVIDPRLAILFKFPQFSGTNLYLSKQAPASKDRGSAMTYTLHYHNFGDTPAQNVVLEDTLPAEVEFISASDGGSYDSNARKVTWNIGSVTPSGHGYETVSVRIPQSVQIGTVIQNDASISTSNLEVRYDDNDAHAQTTVTGSSLPPDVGVEPNNGGTGTPSIYWTNPITFSYHSCEEATGVDIRIQINDDGPDITGTMAGGPPDWTYTTTFYPRHGRATITYTVYACDVDTVSFDIYIDPAGYIYDADTGDRIADATVWLQWPDGEGG
jgi:uncharacterized repeat protein (TIGR01451 family)